MKSTRCVNGFLIAATAHGVRGTDAVPDLVEFSRRATAMTNHHREVIEIKPVGIDCFLPRSTAGDDQRPAKGTARVLSVRFTSPTFDLVGQTTVSAVQLVKEAPPTEWTALLHRRGTLFAPAIAPLVLQTYVLDAGLQEPSDLDLLGTAAHAAARQGHRRSRANASVRAASADREFHVALLEGDQVAAMHNIKLSKDINLETAMSIVADLAFVSWLKNEATNLVPRVLSGRVDAAEAIRTYLSLDELYESHRRSDHFGDTQRLLGAFGAENQWIRLGNRIEMAGWAQKWDSS